MISGLLVFGWFFIFNVSIPCVLFVSARTMGLGLWFICIALKGARLLYLYRFSESKASWRRSLVQSPSLINPSTSSLSHSETSDMQGKHPTSSFIGSTMPTDQRNNTYPPQTSPMITVDLASGRLHLPISPPPDDDTFNTTPYSTWWFENRERVADERLARVLVVVGVVLFLYCFALLFVPQVGVVPRMVVAPFGPGGANFENVTRIGVGEVIKEDGVVQESCSQFSWPFFPVIGVEVVFTLGCFR
ncbi:hypothetical protein BC829DRAFT_262186 [Chytridium lagenaria]|nr:hypothetical protein BC829DRAFT_262186 [Chytridium lagenaria]